MRQLCQDNGWVLVPDNNESTVITTHGHHNCTCSSNSSSNSSSSDQELLLVEKEKQNDVSLQCLGIGYNAQPVLTRTTVSGSTTPHSITATTTGIDTMQHKANNGSVTAAATFAALVAAVATPRSVSSGQSSPDTSQCSSRVYSSNSSYISKDNSRRNSQHGHQQPPHDLHSLFASKLALSSSALPVVEPATTTVTPAATTNTTATSSPTIQYIRRSSAHSVQSEPSSAAVTRVVCDGLTIDITMAESSMSTAIANTTTIQGSSMMTYSKDISRPQSSSSSSSPSLITSSMKVANTENSTETPNIGNRTITTATTTTNYCLKVNDHYYLYRTLDDFLRLDELLRSISNDHVNAAGVPILSGSVYNSDDNNSIGTRTLRSLKQYLKRASVSQATSSMTTTPTTTPTTQTITSYLQCLLDAFGGPHAPPAETDLLEKLRCGVHIFLELDLLETWSAANNNDMSTSSLHRQSLGTALSTISSSYSSTSMSNKLSQEDMLSSLYAPNNRTSTEEEKEDMNTKTDRTIRDMRSRKMNIEDFELCYVLGRGSMGKVFLAKDRETQHHYALKCIAKHRLIEQQELYHARSERDILATLSRVHHPFLIRLLYSFQNQDQLFLVLDYHRGGDIAGELTRLHHFDEQRVLFYAQELVLGIAELHRLGIIYRDLKPENILIAQDGHIILTDFGLSKQFTQGNPSQKQELSRKYRGTSQCQWISNALVDHDDHDDHNDNMHHSATRLSTSSDLLNDDEDANASTDTFCGTAEYLAPEVLMGDRYSYAVDWWSLGTVLYEMLFGITPFWDDNHMIMYRRVLRETVQFPANVPEETKSFLNRLLDRNPSRRLGHGVDGVRQLKEHPFFKDTNWEDVINKQVPVPYIPSATDMDDVQHFEEEFLSMTPQLSPIAPYMRDFVSRRALDASAQICFEGFSFDERGLSNSISSMWNNHHQQQQQQQSSSTNTTTTNGDDDDDDCSL